MPNESVKPQLQYDMVAVMMDHRPDLVEAMFASGHSRHCNYVPEVDKFGNIYCRTCQSQISNINDPIVCGRYVG
jgi:hypothetical protein